MSLQTTAGVSHISCQSGKWQGFVSQGDKVTFWKACHSCAERWVDWNLCFPKLFSSVSDGIMPDLAILPRTLHHLIASGTKTFEVAILPYQRQGGQQFDFAVMALQQHLGDASRAAEVAIDLERRMRAEEIGVSAC